MTPSRVKEFLIGEPFPTSMEIHERLDKFRALAVFASDPISSNAYATEAIMGVLVVLGSGALRLTLPIGLAVAALVLMVIFSYVQTILHYPDGGGAYTVSKDNLGTFPSLIAGAALLTDYVLTVSVSASAGVRAVTSAFPEVFDYRVLLALGAIALITWVNLRGVRESGTIFAIPTYAFVLGGWIVIGIGLARTVGLFGLDPIPPVEHTIAAEASLAGFAYIWLLLRAFAGGTTALTGIEAISNGVQAFKPPESKNAAQTMVMMGFMAMSLFVGITYLATHIGIVPSHGESVLSQLARLTTGRGFLYFWVQGSTMLILFLAANTGYQDFPRLSSFLARDGFLPRWMANRGDRLVFSSGIVVLALVSSAIVVVFQADEIAMLPLYALGVMLSFSLSQAGMFKLMGRIAHLKPGEHLKTDVTEVHYERGVWWKRLVNLIGATTTFIVFLILTATKFLEGAWIVAVTIPILVLTFILISRHYEGVADALSTGDVQEEDLSDVADVVLIPIGDVHRGIFRALNYAKRMSDDVRAVCISTSPAMRDRIERRWMRFPEITEGIELVLIDYDFRDILSPLADYIQRVNHEEFPHQLVTVVIPEFVTEHWWERLLHNRTAVNLRRKLHEYKDIVVIDVPYHIVSTKAWRRGESRDQALRGQGPDGDGEDPN